MAKEWRRETAQRRGGGHLPVPIDTSFAESDCARDRSSVTSEEMFDQQWALTLLNLTLTRLREEFLAAGKPGDFEVLKEVSEVKIAVETILAFRPPDHSPKS